MFIVLLTFTDNKEKAGEFMEAHNLWVKSGIEEGVFILVGGIKPGRGGAVIAQGESLEQLETRVGQDPFVAENIVSAEILEIEPKKVDQRLSFLLD